MHGHWHVATSDGLMTGFFSRLEFALNFAGEISRRRGLPIVQLPA